MRTVKGATVTVLILTDTGLTKLEPQADRWRAVRLRDATNARALAADPHDAGTLYIGTRGDGAWRSADAGETWTKLDLPCDDVFALAVSAADGHVYAGCEPSRLYVSDDGGATWSEREALRRLPSAPTWSFPPRPWTSHVSAIAPHPTRAGLVLLGIELGGLMRSADAGRSWRDHAPGAQRDVHALAWHPSGDGRAYEAGGGGAARSDDHGETWRPADAGRDLDYCWGLAVLAGEPETWLVSASPSARRAHGERPAQAGVYRWREGGPWRRVGEGLPEPMDDMPYALAANEERVLVGLRSGRLFLSDDQGETWGELQIVGAELAGLRSIEVVRPTS